MLAQDTAIKFAYQEIKGEGKIVGQSSYLPPMGYMYIVQTNGQISNEYPYTTFVCPECYITLKD